MSKNQEVQRIKNEENLPEIQPTKNIHIFSPEFSGTKQVRGSKAIEAQVNHGIIVQQLYDELTSMGHQVANDQYIDLFIFTGDKVEHIFEVKPDLSNSNLYSGIGQLVVYSVEHDAKLHLVIPEGLSDEMKEHLKNFGVNVLEYQMKDDKVAFNNMSLFQN